MEVLQWTRESAQRGGHITRTARDHTRLILLTVCPGGVYWPSDITAYYALGSGSMWSLLLVDFALVTTPTSSHQRWLRNARRNLLVRGASCAADESICRSPGPFTWAVHLGRRVASTRNSGVSTVGLDIWYSPGATLLIESTRRPLRSVSKRSSRGV